MSKHYRPEWESLIEHQVPDWFLDAKFGIYAHWGLYSIPGFGNEWYGKYMYDPEHPVHVQHVQRYGSPARFGYKDFIPMFTASRYDPEKWADLVVQSGASYGGFSLAHHDGFGLWDSDVYRWNVGKMGPGRDLYGEFASALRARGARLVAPFHIIRGYNWFLPGWTQWTRTVPEAAVERGRAESWDLYDPKLAEFYWHQFVGADFEKFLRLWKLKVKEVIDRYEPDVMWFDGGRFNEPDLVDHSLEVLAHYLNAACEWGKDVAVLNKLNTTLVLNFHERFGVRQFEEGRDRPHDFDLPFNDDMRIGDKSWGWVEGQTYRSSAELVHGIIDRASRGGSLLLSLSPKADGEIPDGQRASLRGVGDWLRHCGDAIHGSRRWRVSSEGDLEKLYDRSRAGHRRWTFTSCTAEDLRYTTSKDGETIYAFTLGRPGDRVRFPALGKRAGNLNAAPRSVRLLGVNRPAAFEWTEDALEITVRERPPVELAYAWQIDLSPGER